MEMNNFEERFNDEEEISDALDTLISTIGEAIEADESKPGVLNPIRLKQMQFSYSVLKYLSHGKNIKISYALHEPFKSMGSISVEGKSIDFTNAEWFSRVAEFASSTEIYPLVNGNVRMTLTFHGLINPVS